MLFFTVLSFFFFFFQAEDGIRDHCVTGVQTCALPICDRHGILLCADEVITGFGRIGYWFASEKYDVKPDLVTCAKGLSSAYAAIGAVVTTNKVMEPFLDGASMFSHGITFGGHPVMCAIALKN